MRVLVVHNRYRLEGGEERSVELQLEALSRAGVEHALLERSSADASRARPPRGPCCGAAATRTTCEPPRRA